jgi:hypothetical protein
MKTFLGLFVFSMLATAQDTVTLQVNPINMSGLDGMTGLDKVGAGLWNGVVRNDSTLIVKISFEDMQLAFPQINFLTAIETNILLNRKQAMNFKTILYNLFKDAMAGASVFASAWFLVSQPIIQQIDPQLAATQPNVSMILALTGVTSFTLAPGDKATIVMLAGKMPKDNVHSYIHTMRAVAQQMVQPPAVLKEIVPYVILPTPAPVAPAAVAGWEIFLEDSPFSEGN